MNRYVLAVRRWWMIPIVLVLLVLVCGTVGGVEVPVPSLAGNMTGARLAYFSPVVVVIAIMYCLERRLPEAENTAVVSIRRFDQGAVVLSVVLAHGAGLMMGMDVARNIALVLALALIARRLINEATAAAVGLLFLIINLILGRAHDASGHGSHTWWALTLYPAGSPTAWLVAITLFAVSLMLSEARHLR